MKMKQLSMVSAKVLRQNENYKYRLAGKGERYLVYHNEDDSPIEIVKNYLRPYVIEEPSIDSVALQRGVSYVEDSMGDYVWRAQLRYTSRILLENGTEKERKVSAKYLVCADDMSQAFESIVAYLESNTEHPSSSLVSISRVNVIEVIER